MHKVAWLVGLAVVLVVGLGGAAPVLARYPGGYMNDLTTEVVTPHVAWAKPYAGGAVRGLFIVPYWYAAREVVELAERMDLQFDAVTTQDSTHLGWDNPGSPDPYTRQVEGTSPAEKTAQLKALLARPHDVIVLAHFSLEALPPELQYEILSQVKAGTGLLITYYTPGNLPLLRTPDHAGAREILAGVPVAGLPYFRQNPAAKCVQTATIGKGRVVAISYPGAVQGTYYGGYGLTPLQEPPVLPRQIYYDYYQSLIAKAMLWAAGKDLPASVGLPVKDGESVTWGAKGGGVLYSGPGPAGPTRPGDWPKLTVTVRSEETGEVEQTIQTTEGGAYHLDGLPAGGHFLDEVISNGQGVRYWGSAYFTVPAPQPGGITDVKLVPHESSARPSEVRGTVTLNGRAAGLRLEFSASDMYGRVFARASRPAAGVTTVDFAVPLSAAVAHWANLDVRLYRGAQCLQVVRRGFPVPGVRPDEYPMVLWGTDDLGWLGLLWLRQCREDGFTSVLQYHWPEQRARADLTFTPYISHIPDGVAYGDYTQILDPQYRKQKTAELVERTRQLAPYGPFLYDLGDEDSYDPQALTRPGDMEDFRRFLTAKYGSLAAADRAWGGAVPDWQALTLLSPDKARKTGQWVRYHDQLSHAEAAYADILHWQAQAIKSVDPTARVGAEGSVAGNLEETIHGLDFWGPYNERYYNSLLRSLAPRTLWRGNWWGGYMWQRRPETLSYDLWQWTLEGNNFLEYYASGGSEGFYSADFRQAYFFDWERHDLQELKHGIGTLIARSEFTNDGVALVQSQPSAHLAELLNGVNSWQRSQDSLLEVLDDVGLQYRYLTPRQVEGGELAREKMRVLLLGDVMAVSPAMARQIREFVAAGGLVLADTSPAIAGGNCEPRAHGQLDDVFGVTQSGQPERSAPGRLHLAGAWGGRAVKLDESGLIADAGVALRGGQALAQVGQTPVLIRHRYGQGEALLLNFSAGAVSPDTRAGLAELLRGLLAERGLGGAYQVTGAQGNLLPGVRIMAMRHGAVTTLGVTVTPESGLQAAPALLTLRRPAHVYDVRNRRYLGYGDRFPLTLSASDARVLALLPYQVRTVSLTPGPAQAGQPLAVTLRVETSAGAAAGHVLCLQVQGPDGQARPYYEQLVTMDGPQASVTIPLAYNDPPGRWRLLVRDVATGITASAGVQVAASR